MAHILILLLMSENLAMIDIVILQSHPESCFSSTSTLIVLQIKIDFRCVCPRQGWQDGGLYLCWCRESCFRNLTTPKYFGSSAYQNCVRNAGLTSAYSSYSEIHCFPCSQTSPIRDLTCGHTASILSRVVGPSFQVSWSWVGQNCSIGQFTKDRSLKAFICWFLWFHSGLWLRKKSGYKKKIREKYKSKRKMLQGICVVQ